jgi:hypothetical protein
MGPSSPAAPIICQPPTPAPGISSRDGPFKSRASRDQRSFARGGIRNIDDPNATALLVKLQTLLRDEA